MNLSDERLGDGSPRPLAPASHDYDCGLPNAPIGAQRASAKLLQRRAGRSEMLPGSVGEAARRAAEDPADGSMRLRLWRPFDDGACGGNGGPEKGRLPLAAISRSSGDLVAVLSSFLRRPTHRYRLPRSRCSHG